MSAYKRVFYTTLCAVHIMYEQNMLLDNKVADAAELKNIEKDIRKEVQDALKKAKVTVSAQQYSALFRTQHALLSAMRTKAYKLLLLVLAHCMHNVQL
jgi:hypothetical protein